MRTAWRPRVVAAGLMLVMALTACGPQPPDGATLLTQSSQRMLGLKGFHFQMQHVLTRLVEQGRGARRRRPARREPDDDREAGE